MSTSLANLKRAVILAEKIAELEKELDATLGGSMSSEPATGKRRGRPPGIAKPKKGKRVMSAEAREKIAAAQRRRWSKVAKAKGDKVSPVSEKPAKKRKKRTISPEGLQRIKDAQAKRWAAVRKAAKE